MYNNNVIAESRAKQSRCHKSDVVLFSSFYLREGISQENVPVHPFDAAREREKLAKSVSIRFHKKGLKLCMM